MGAGIIPAQEYWSVIAKYNEVVVSPAVFTVANSCWKLLEAAGQAQCKGSRRNTGGG